MSDQLVSRPVRTTVARASSQRATLLRLARLETRRYARHPLFVIGVLGTAILTLASKTDPQTASFFYPIVPAAAVGILGLVAMASLTRNADTLRRSAGAPAVPERIQTGALALACLLPFAVGIAWFAWAVWNYHHYPPPAKGFPFGGMSTGWKWGELFGMGTMSTLGGPLLGIVIGRWWPKRGVAPMSAVLLVAAVIIMQGLFAPLRRARVVMPFTNWGGSVGNNPQHWLIFPGSPQWWVAYLLCLCGLAVVAALWHDPGARTPTVRTAAMVLLIVAVVTCALAMYTGIGHTLTNPLPS